MGKQINLKNKIRKQVLRERRRMSVNDILELGVRKGREGKSFQITKRRLGKIELNF